MQAKRDSGAKVTQVIFVLCIELFGRTRLFDGVTPFERAVRPKVVPLLAYVLLNAGRHVERRHVASDLWPDSLEEDARANLRRHLQYLRAYLPPGIEWFSANGSALS